MYQFNDAVSLGHLRFAVLINELKRDLKETLEIQKKIGKAEFLMLISGQ